MTSNVNPITGGGQDDVLTGTDTNDRIIGLAGDDQITSGNGDDQIFGDFEADNLLHDADDALTFVQYADSGRWTLATDQDGTSTMSQTIQTTAGTTYEMSFEIAVNYASGALDGAVEVLWNNQVVGTYDTASALFDGVSVSVTGTGGDDVLSFREIAAAPNPDAPQIHTDGPVFSYDKTMDWGDGPIEVQAIAPGQNNIYQVINGTLYAFDPASETYTKAGVNATVTINAIGFNAEDDLLYGLAVRTGTDALGNAVGLGDVMAIDATGASYRVGESPYRSWTADFDDQGNLWAFHSSMDRVTRIDVDTLDANGNPVSETFKFPKEMVTDKVWDVAYDAATKSFYGLVTPNKEGDAGKLFTIDISAVADGGQPVFSTTDVTHTVIDGITQDGMPRVTFGAFMIDGDGNFYAGANSGDHDMNDSTGSSGGIFRIIRNADSARIELVSDAPRSYSNDGAVDPRAMDPFAEVDPSSTLLIRDPSLREMAEPSKSYDDTVHAGNGQDEVSGGLGDDMLIGEARGDVLTGGVGNDYLHGGAGPDGGSGIISVYDDDGLRYDQFGTLLPENDDILRGGDGADELHGSAGHDLLDGGTGNDTLIGGSGSDRLYGGDGTDTLSGGSQDDQLDGGAGDDTLSGGSGNDMLSGGLGADVLKGGSGNDVLDGGTGKDKLDGGTGNDTLTGGAGDDRLKSGSGDDIVFGGDGRDYINAHKGDDIINGGAGKDKIYLGAGNDIASGGADADTFVFRSGDMDGSTDRITDFDLSEDLLNFKALNLSFGSTTDWLNDVCSIQDGAATFALLGNTTLILDNLSGSDSEILLGLSDAVLLA